MEVPYTIYETYTGMITRVGACKEELIKAQAGPGQAILLGRYAPASYYVNPSTGEAMQKEPMMLSFFGGKINGIPFGSTLFVEETKQVLRADDLANIKLEKNGTYHVRVTHPQYRDGQVTLEMFEE